MGRGQLAPRRRFSFHLTRRGRGATGCIARWVGYVRTGLKQFVRLFRRSRNNHLARLVIGSPLLESDQLLEDGSADHNLQEVWRSDRWTSILYSDPAGRAWTFGEPAGSPIMAWSVSPGVSQRSTLAWTNLSPQLCNKEDIDMSFKPDPTFYPSPGMAMKAAL